MKNIFTKKNLMPLIVLSSICLVVAALMGGVNLITEQRIFDNEQKKISASLSDVMPNGVFEKIEIPEDAPSTVTAIYKDSVSGGHVVTLAKQGYASIIKITVGIDIDQKVTNMIITNMDGQSVQETEIDIFDVSKEGVGFLPHHSILHISIL